MKTAYTIAIALSAALLISGCERPKMGAQQGPQGPIPVNAIEVKTGDLPSVIEVTGQIQASNTVQVYSRVAGYLQKRNYVEGSKVHEGDTLFTIDPSDLTNTRNNAKAALMQAEAAHDNAKATLARIKPLAEVNAVSKQDLDSAIANEKSTAASVEAAKASLAQAELNLSYTKVKAPVNGYADKTKIDLGTYITVGGNNLLTTVYQTDPIYVSFSISENQKLAFQSALNSGKLASKNGKYEVELMLADGTKLDRTGIVDFAAPFFDTATGTMSYRATVKNADAKLMPGQFVRVVMKGMEWKDAVVIPQKSVLTGDKGKFVFVYENNNTVSPRPVQLGEWSGQSVVVTSGLKVGDKVVSDNLTKLRPGAQVSLVPAK